MTDTNYVLVPGMSENIEVAFSATDTTKTIYLYPSTIEKSYPYVYRGFAVIPDWTNAVTLSVAFIDAADGNNKTLDNQYTALAKNGTRELASLHAEIPNKISCVLTLSGAPGGSGGTVYLTLYSTENAGNALLEAEVTGEVKASLYADVGGTPTKMEGESTGELKTSLYADVGGTPTKVEEESTGELKVSLYADVGGTPTKIETETTGELKSSVYGDVGGTPTKAEIESTGEWKASLYANVGGTPTKVDMQASGELDTNISMVAGVAQVLDNTSTPRTSIYGKATNAGDTPVLLESDGKAKTSLYGYNAAAGDTAIEAESTGELKASLYGNVGGTPTKLDAQATGELDTNVSLIAGVAPTMQNTSFLAVGINAKNAAAADVPVQADASGQLQIDIQKIDGQDPKLDNTNVLGVSLYAKSSAAGDKPVLVDSDGHLQIDVLSTSGTASVNVAQFGGVNVQMDDTDKPAISVYFKNSASGDTSPLVESDGKVKTSAYGYNAAAGDTAIEVESTGELKTSLYADVGGTPTKVEEESTGELKVSLYANVSGTPTKVDMQSSGELDANISMIAGVAQVLDNTSTPRTSIYGKATNAGDTPVLLESDGKAKTSLYGYNAAAGDTAIEVESTGEEKVSLYVDNGGTPVKLLGDAAGHAQVDLPAVGLDNTNKLSVSLWAKASAAGDKEVLVDSDGHVQVDALTLPSVAGTVDIEIAGNPPSLDNTDKLAVSLWAKASAAGDKEVLVDSDGHVQIDALTLPAVTGTVNVEVGGQAPQLDDTDKIAVSLYGKSSNAGDMPILVDASGNVQCELPGVQLDDTDKLAVSLYGKASAAGDKEVLVDSDGHIQADILSAPTIAIKSAPKIKTTQATIDLPANSSACAEIDTSGANTRELHVYVREEFRWCCAADGTAAATAIASDTSSAILPAGYWCFAVNNTYKFYLRSNDASALTDGVSYWLGEE